MSKRILVKEAGLMDFFKSFYDQFVYTLEPTISNKLFSALVNNSIKKADSLLSLNPFCTNPELRYLILTYLIKQSEYNKFLPRTTIQSNLRLLSQYNPYLKQRELAKKENRSYVNKASTKFNKPQPNIAPGSNGNGKPRSNGDGVVISFDENTKDEEFVEFTN